MMLSAPVRLADRAVRPRRPVAAGGLPRAAAPARPCCRPPASARHCAFVATRGAGARAATAVAASSAAAAPPPASAVTLLSDVADYAWLLWYAAVDASPLAKACALAATLLALWAFTAARARLLRMLTELQVMDEEARRAAPGTPPLWRGWGWSWRDGWDYLHEVYAFARQQHDARKEQQRLLQAQREAAAQAAEARKRAEGGRAARARSHTCAPFSLRPPPWCVCVCARRSSRRGWRRGSGRGRRRFWSGRRERGAAAPRRPRRRRLRSWLTSLTTTRWRGRRRAKATMRWAAAALQQQQLLKGRALRPRPRVAARALLQPRRRRERRCARGRTDGRSLRVRQHV